MKRKEFPPRRKKRTKKGAGRLFSHHLEKRCEATFFCEENCRQPGRKMKLAGLSRS